MGKECFNLVQCYISLFIHFILYCVILILVLKYIISVCNVVHYIV